MRVCVAGGWVCVCMCMFLSDQVLPSLMRLYTKKTKMCSLYRLAAGEKILHMESFTWHYN